MCVTWCAAWTGYKLSLLVLQCDTVWRAACEGGTSDSLFMVRITWGIPTTLTSHGLICVPSHVSTCIQVGQE